MSVHYHDCIVPTYDVALRSHEGRETLTLSAKAMSVVAYSTVHKINYLRYILVEKKAIWYIS